MRYSIAAAALLFSAAVFAACRDTTSEGDCYEPTGDAYPVHLPGDTTITFRWPDSYLPVRYYAEPVEHTIENVAASLVLWEGALRCNELRLITVADSLTADVVVRNPALMPPPPAAAAVMYADSIGACQARTDMVLDSLGRLERPVRIYVVPFNVDTASVNGCYRYTTAHEIGHSLGLLHHSSNPEDLMYSRPFRRVLSNGDRYTVQLLYRVVNPTVPPEAR